MISCYIIGAGPITEPYKRELLQTPTKENYYRHLQKRTTTDTYKRELLQTPTKENYYRDLQKNYYRDLPKKKRAIDVTTKPPMLEHNTGSVVTSMALL